MSLKWDDIETRQKQTKQKERELKQFLVQQQEEVKKRKQQEKASEREYSRQLVFGKEKPSIGNTVEEKPIVAQVQQLQEVTPKLNNVILNPMYDLFKINEPIVEKRETDWQSKYLLGSMSAKLEQLQDQSRRETERVHELARTMMQKDRESKEQIDSLQRKLEVESEKVSQLLHELSKQNQRNELIHVRKDSTIQQLQERLDQLGQRFDQYANQQNEVGNAVTHTSKELMLEVQKSQDTVKAVKKHEMQLVSMSNAIESSSESFARKMQLAAQELVQRVEAETKARRKLEESIRMDAMEFRRVIERHISDRVESLHAYTAAKQEQDKQEFESIAMGLHSKLQKLEATSADSQEQLVLMMNQRLEILETTLIESEKASQKSEMRIHEAIKTSMEVFESSTMKKEGETEKRFKELNKNMTQMQKAIAGSLELSEKSIQAKLKNHEEVLRAEIKARMETDKVVETLGEELKKMNDNLHSQVTQINGLIEGLQTDHDKVLELVKGVTQQITKSQDKWITNFENEVARLTETMKGEGKQVAKAIHSAKEEFETMKEDFSRDIDEKLSEWEYKVGEVVKKTQELEEFTFKLNQDFEGKTEELNQKLVARSVQFDSTLEALKIELAARPTHDVIQKQIDDINQELETARTEISEEVSQIRNELNDEERFVELAKEMENKVEGIVQDFSKRIQTIKLSTEQCIDEMRVTLEAEQQAVQEIQSQFTTMLENHDTLEEAMNGHSSELYQLKAFQKETMQTASRFETQFRNMASSIHEIRDCNDAHEIKIKDLQSNTSLLEESFEDKFQSISQTTKDEHEDLRAEIERTTSSLLQLKSQAEATHQEQKLELKETLDAVSSSQKQILQEINKKVHSAVLELHEKNEDLHKRVSKLSTTVESQNRQIHREVDKLQDSLKEVVIQQETNQELLNSFTNNLQSIREGNQMAMQQHVSKLDDLKGELLDLFNQTKEHDYQLKRQLNELSQSNSLDNEEFMSHIKSLTEDLVETKNQLENRLREIQSKCDTNAKELRKWTHQQGSINAELKANTKLNRMQQNEQEMEMPEYFEPLNDKLDMLVNYVKNLEDSIAQSQYAKPQKSYSTTTASFYKPSQINFRARDTTDSSAPLLPPLTKASSRDMITSRAQKRSNEVNEPPQIEENATRSMANSRGSFTERKVISSKGNIESRRDSFKSARTPASPLQYDSYSVPNAATPFTPKSEGIINDTESFEEERAPLKHTPSNLEF